MKRRKKLKQPRKPQPAPQKRKPAKVKGAASQLKAATALAKVSPKKKAGKTLSKATNRLRRDSAGNYKLGDRPIVPGQGYSIKRVITNRRHRAYNLVVKVISYFIVWKDDGTTTRISKALAEHLHTLSTSGTTTQVRPKKAAAKKAAPKKAAAKKAAPKKAAAKKRAPGGPDHPHVRSIPKRPGDKK